MIEINKGIDGFRIISYSWKIVTPTIFIKIIDKSALHNNGTVIPQDITRFFNVDDMERRETREIVLIHDDLEYLRSIMVTGVEDT